MTMPRAALVLAALLAAELFAPSAHAREVAGVNVPETLSVDGKTLRLNGAGLRKKFVVKVYVGALYLESQSTSPAEILKSDQARVVRMTFLRGVDKGKILGAYEEGFEKNSKDQLPALRPGLDKLKAALGDVKSGQVMTVRYAPGKGVTVEQEGGASVLVEGKQFADALFRNWLGAAPADGDLKSAMLAGK
jgi:hypothetical protein